MTREASRHGILLILIFILGMLYRILSDHYKLWSQKCCRDPFSMATIYYNYKYL